MEKIYTDTADFERIRVNKSTYVDKTDIIYNLINESFGSQFFLSRPRRFGKSLLLSTIRCIFEGKRELFDGLKISQTDWDWEAEKCPVIKLDMSTCTGDLEQVKKRIDSVLMHASENVGVTLRDDDEISIKFKSLILSSAKKSPTGKVVVLIDEYDAPLFKYLGTPDVKPYQELLKEFYTTIKATGSHLRFCLMTGVSKFSKVSIFSALNNLVDLSMDTNASTLLGYTHDEVKQYFPQCIEALAHKHCVDKHEAFDLLVCNYDGYCFDDSLKRVFNPVSLGKSLSSSKIKSYWFETGTPSWLMNYLKTRPLIIENLSINEAELGTFEPDNPPIVTLLFQTGYLTIDSTEEFYMRTRYKLRFPNFEVEDGFNTWLTQAYVKEPAIQLSTWQYECITAVRDGDPEAFIESLQSFFASIGYDLSDRLNEQAYQNITVAILRFIGLSVGGEITTSKGRIDMVCESGCNVFIVEMKIATGTEACENAAKDAIVQIKNREYAQPYFSDVRSDTKNVFLLGITFDCETHNISKWKAEKL